MQRREHTIFSIILVMLIWIIERFYFQIILGDFYAAFLISLMFGTFADLDIILAKTAKYHRSFLTHSVIIPGIFAGFFLISEYWFNYTAGDFYAGIAGWQLLGWISLSQASHLILDLFPSDACISRWDSMKRMLFKSDAPGIIKGPIPVKYDAIWLIINALLCVSIYIFSLIYCLELI